MFSALPVIEPRRCHRVLHTVTVLITQSNANARFVLIAAKSNIVTEASLSCVPLESMANPTPIHLPMLRATVVDLEVEIEEFAAAPVAPVIKIPKFQWKSLGVPHIH